MEITNLAHQVMIRRLGMEEKVISFTNPEEALDSLKIDAGKLESVLVLLDINMPEMTGFEFLEFMELEDFHGHIDVIVVTSSVSDEDRILAEQYPRFVRDFVVKPLKIETLKDIILRSQSA